MVSVPRRFVGRIGDDMLGLLLEVDGAVEIDRRRIIGVGVGGQRRDGGPCGTSAVRKRLGFALAIPKQGVVTAVNRTVRLVKRIAGGGIGDGVGRARHLLLRRFGRLFAWLELLGGRRILWQEPEKLRLGLRRRNHQ